MTIHRSSMLRFFIIVGLLLLPVATALAHPGHGAPEVHAHIGSPSLLVVLAILTLGIAALVPLVRFLLRLRRRLHQR